MRHLFLISLLFIFGCAQYGGYRPTIDTYNDPGNLSRDSIDCQQLAASATNVEHNALQNTGVGAVVGATFGAIIGAFTGNPGTGAALGASVGSFGGLTKGIVSSDDTYKRVYKNCLHNRGHNVVD